MSTIDKKPIDAVEFSIEDLFDGNKVYKVPDYQRMYAWGIDELEDLVKDLESVSGENQHFLGTIVVIPVKQSAKVNVYEIVDGQQRMATLLIWLSAIRDLLKDKNLKDAAQRINRKFLFYEHYMSGELYPRIRLNRMDDNIFQKILKGHANLVSDKDHPVVKAYGYLKEYSRDKNLEMLMDKILKKISIVHIEVKNYLIAFKLFETLNDRGLELSAADLIKNFLLMRITEKNNSIIDEAVEKWNDMFENVRDIEPVKFIRRYMLSEYPGKISEAKLYEYTTEKFENLSIDDILKFIDDLRKFSKIYRKIAKAECIDSEINIYLKNLNMIEVSPSYTLLMRIFDLYEQGGLNKKEVLQILSLVERFHIWWGITGLYTGKLDTIYNDISMNIKEKVKQGSGELGKEIIESISKEYQEEIKNYLPNPVEDFIKRFESRKFKPSSARTKYILWKLSMPTGETTLNVVDIHTEHIMPKTLNNDWKKYLMKEANILTETELKEKHKEYVNKIGNLTIIKGSWNQSMSNRIFNEKKKDYQKSDISITKELTHYERWTFEDIENRSGKLANRAIEIWNLFEESE